MAAEGTDDRRAGKGDADARRSGGPTDRPHGTQGPPTDADPDEPRHAKPGKASDGARSTKPTKPVEGTTVRSGKPGEI